MWLFAIGFCGSLNAALLDNTNLPDPTSSLLPPRGEILPTFWEQYGAWVILASVLFLLALALVIWLLFRPRAVVPLPWAIQARQQLEPLHHQPEDGMLLSEVSRRLRQQVAAGFGLSSDEATTVEFCRTVAASEKIGPELASELSGFLKECDRRKFAPAPPATAFGAVGGALKIIELAEHRLARLNTSGASAGNPESAPSAKQQPEQKVAGGV